MDDWFIDCNLTNTSVICEYENDKSEVVCDGETFESNEYYEPGEGMFFVYMGAYIFATCFAGE